MGLMLTDCRMEALIWYEAPPARLVLVDMNGVSKGNPSLTARGGVLWRDHKERIHEFSEHFAVCTSATQSRQDHGDEKDLGSAGFLDDLEVCYKPLETLSKEYKP